jgi:hypothetical protein
LINVDRTLEELHRAVTVADPPHIADELLAFSGYEDDNPAHLMSVTSFVCKVWDEMDWNPNAVDRASLCALVRRLEAIGKAPDEVRAAFDYLALWAEVRYCFKEHGLTLATCRDLEMNKMWLDVIRDAVETQRSKSSTNYGSMMLEGLLTSIDNRAKAAELFQAAATANSRLNGALGLDHFITTYFSSEEIEANATEISSRRADLIETFEVLNEPRGSEEGTLFLFSCDPTYFSAFFPYWVGTVDYLKRQNVCLHFMLVGDPSETTAAVTRGLSLAYAVSSLHGASQRAIEENLSFSTVAVPAFVDHRRTYCASVRYMLGRELSKRFSGSVLVLDIDMVLKEDPAPVLQQLRDASGVQVPMVMTRGMRVLYPYRRYLAGCLAVPTGEAGEWIMQAVEDYLYIGLSKPRAWRLDQNALTYAAERAATRFGSECLVDGHNIMRPFLQPFAKRLFLEGQMALEGRL